MSEHEPAGVELVDTPSGTARVQVRYAGSPGSASPPDGERGLVMLGHGAGGGVAAPDLSTVTSVALHTGWAVALVEQPYRVAGRRAPAPARQLDAAWTAVTEQLQGGPFAGLPLVVGGRSSGARVACRTAADLDAAGVLCLAFPLQPPKDRPSRLPELEAVTVPTLVVQGDRDRFGMPPAAPGRTIAVVPGDHSLKPDQHAIATAVGDWLAGIRLT